MTDRCANVMASQIASMLVAESITVHIQTAAVAHGVIIQLPACQVRWVVCVRLQRHTCTVCAESSSASSKSGSTSNVAGNANLFLVYTVLSEKLRL
jgi:hypothetical protein